MLSEFREIKEMRKASEFQPKRETLVTVACQSCSNVLDNLVSADTAIIGWVLACTDCGEEQAVVKAVFD